VARPVNHEHRARLLEAAVDLAIGNGASVLSLRPMASALGVTPTTLVHHFGSRDEFLAAIINRVRERIVSDIQIDRDSDREPADLARAAWAWMSHPSHRQLYRFLFELYGMALGEPERFGSFLDRVVEDWLDTLTAARAGTRQEKAAARAQATLGLAVTRGLMLDLVTTGDTKRVNQAFESFAASLETARAPSH
jgi:AcrR family transcriptional regulator